MGKEERIKEIKALMESGAKGCLKELLSYAHDENHDIKLAVIDALPWNHPPLEAKNVLIELTRDSDWEVRARAIEALKFISSEDIGNAIMPRLRDPHRLVRVFASETLGDLNYKKAIPEIVKMLSEKDFLIRTYAAYALGQMGDKELIPTLESSLKKETRNRARLDFYIALYKLHKSVADDYLDSALKMLKSRSETIRIATANALVLLADESDVSKIIEALEDAAGKEKVERVSSVIKEVLAVLCKEYDLGNNC